MITVPLCDSLDKRSEPSGALDDVADMFTTSANEAVRKPGGKKITNYYNT